MIWLTVLAAVPGILALLIEIYEHILCPRLGVLVKILDPHSRKIEVQNSENLELRKVRIWNRNHSPVDIKDLRIIVKGESPEGGFTTVRIMDVRRNDNVMVPGQTPRVWTLPKNEFLLLHGEWEYPANRRPIKVAAKLKVNTSRGEVICGRRLTINLL